MKRIHHKISIRISHKSLRISLIYKIGLSINKMSKDKK